MARLCTQTKQVLFAIEKLVINTCLSVSRLSSTTCEGDTYSIEYKLVFSCRACIFQRPFVATFFFTLECQVDINSTWITVGDCIYNTKNTV